MERILVLEDDMQRKVDFLEIFEGLDVTVLATAGATIALLEEHRWDWLFLDHDLGDHWMTDQGHNTGYAVAVWLEEHPEFSAQHTVIHSLNPVGSERMQKAIPKAVQLPGAWLYAFDKVKDYVEKGERQWDGLEDCSDVEQGGLQPSTTPVPTDTEIIVIGGDALERQPSTEGTGRDEDTK